MLQPPARYDRGMNAPNTGSPLTDQDIETLDARLADIDPDNSMVVEELDGFFAALACCPQPVPREEWLALVLGESSRAAAAARGEGADASLLKLIERHRAAVAGMLYDAQGFAPVLSHDEQGRPWGHAWAIGFARGDAMHWNVAIRTLVHKNGRIRANAGGGVTTLSDPAAEYDETLHKLLGIERTLQRRAEAPR